MGDQTAAVAAIARRIWREAYVLASAKTLVLHGTIESDTRTAAIDLLTFTARADNEEYRSTNE
jgi:hypothetical protein